MYGSVWGNDGECVGSVDGSTFRDRQGVRIGEVREGNVYRKDGALLFSLQKIEEPQPGTLSSAEFARLVNTR